VTRGGSGERGDAGELDTLVAGAEASELSVTPETPALVAGRYQILALAGAGAMGSVYRARDTELDEVVALKFLRSELVASADMLERFRREVRLARRVAHRNVARVYDIGEHGADKFLTMAFIEGEPLRAVLARSGALSPARALELVRQIGAGLEAAHAVGVVHRDLKPDNVMVAEGGALVITDFGIARSALGAGGTGATMGGVVGTPAYMAPEQVVAAADIDHRADLYALGVMMFEMLTGELPFRAASPIVVAAARLHEAAPDPRRVRPGLDAGLAEVVMRCMAREPQDRFDGAAAVVAALEAAVESSPVTSTSTSTSAPRSRPTSIPAAAGGGVFTMAGERTVAVLPFGNAGDSEDAYLADGLTEDLIDTLSMTRGLRVRPRSATRRFAGADVDHRAVGEELDVHVIVDGTVRRRGEQLRVTARATSVAEGFQLWAQRFDRPAADALQVSDEVAAAVAAALTVAPMPQHRAAMGDPVAIDLYLRARAALRGLDNASADRALEMLEQAHARAPDDATILAAHARASARVMFFRFNPELADRALHLARRAIAVAPDSGEVELALAQVLFARGEFVEAAIHASRARRRAPLLPEAHAMVGRLQIEVGPLDDAIATLERAVALDPQLQTARLDLARAAAFRGDYGPARAMAAEGGPIELGAQASFVARFAVWSGDADAWLRLMPPLNASDPLSRGSLVNGMIGVMRDRRVPPELEEGMRRIASSTTSPRFRPLLYQVTAELQAFCRDADRAFAAIDDALASGLIDLIWLDLCPALTSIRGDARFATVRAVLSARADTIRDALAT
jgi:serine/threonine-protein kinase